MGQVYHDSTLSDAQIQAALTAIDRVIKPANNGKILCVEDGKIKAKSASSFPGGAVLEPLSVTDNGDYYPDSGVDGFDSVHVAVPGSSPNLQSKTVTPSASQHTVTPDNGYNGLSSVTVEGDADLVAGNIKKKT